MQGQKTRTELLLLLLFRLRKIYRTYETKIRCYRPDWRGSVGWVSSRRAKGRRLDSWPGHRPALRVRSPVRVHTRGS